MTVLVTRTARDGEETIARLAARGIAAIAAPVIEIRPVADVDLPAACRALAVTSVNAIRAIAGRPGLEDLLGVPLYAVGDRTADAARRAGFTDVRSAAGDVEGLGSLLRGEVRPEEGPIVHLSGREVAGDLTGGLATAGYTVGRRIVYEAAPVDALPAEALDAIRRNSVAAVLFYSPKSAEAFDVLARRAGVAGCLKQMAAIAMSPKVAAKARESGFGHIFTADRPDESALFEALERFLKSRPDK